MDEESSQPTSSPPALTQYRYTCRRCRAGLFTTAQVMPHDAAKGAPGNKKFGFRRDAQDEDEAARCTSVFIDPEQCPWASADSLTATAEGLECLPDTIYCPNMRCHAKLGTQSWTGAQCSCGTWVTPAFKILARAVDRMPV